MESLDLRLHWAAAFEAAEVGCYGVFEAVGAVVGQRRIVSRVEDNVIVSRRKAYHAFRVGSLLVKLQECVTYGLRVPLRHPDAILFRPSITVPSLQITNDGTGKVVRHFRRPEVCLESDVDELPVRYLANPFFLDGDPHALQAEQSDYAAYLGWAAEALDLD
jgi:hypothetical protein